MKGEVLGGEGLAEHVVNSLVEDGQQNVVHQQGHEGGDFGGGLVLTNAGASSLNHTIGDGGLENVDDGGISQLVSVGARQLGE